MHSIYEYAYSTCILQHCSTFQGILITNRTSSYTIYECVGMEWGGGTIGWQASTSEHGLHSLSGDPDSNDVGCMYSTNYSAVVFRLESE